MSICFYFLIFNWRLLCVLYIIIDFNIFLNLVRLNINNSRNIWLCFKSILSVNMTYIPQSFEFHTLS